MPSSETASAVSSYFLLLRSREWLSEMAGALPALKQNRARVGSIFLSAFNSPTLLPAGSITAAGLGPSGKSGYWHADELGNQK